MSDTFDPINPFVDSRLGDNGVYPADPLNPFLEGSEIVQDSIPNLTPFERFAFLDEDPEENSNQQRNTGSIAPPLYYPYDLGLAEDLQYMVRFTIYDTGGAVLKKHRETFTKNQKQLQDTIRDSARASADEQGIDAGNSITLSQLAAIGKTAFGSALDAVVNSFGGLEGSGINVDGLGGRRDSFVEEASGFGGLTEEVQSIYLYLPGQMSISYKFDYEDADLSALDILRGLRSLTETQTGQSTAVQAEIAKSLGMAALKVADEAIELVGGQEIFTKNQAAATREIRNPFVVHLFKGVGRRTFRFEFNLLPRSSEEAITIEKIVNTFKMYAHPDRSDGGRYLNFPAEFQIDFLYKNADAIRIPKIMKCALTSISTDYGEATFTTTVIDSGGKVSPTKVKLSLEFSELELLTRERIVRNGA